jgi:hypothetical protein
MLRGALLRHPLDSNIKMGRRLLLLHRQLLHLENEKMGLRWYNALRRLRCSAARWHVQLKLWQQRVTLHSMAALSDFLTALFLLTVAFCMYQMYVVCRVALTRAEEKYTSLAVPVLQSIQALSLQEELKRKRRQQMEEDIARQR